MKTLIQIPKYMALAFAALALAAWIATPSSAAAQEKGAAAASLIKHSAVPGNSSTTAAKASDKPANWCSKCLITQVKVVARPTKTGALPESKLLTRNECSKCVNVLTTVGTGKLAKAMVADSCGVCCEQEPRCCIVNAGACPASPTTVMAKN